MMDCRSPVAGSVQLYMVADGTEVQVDEQLVGIESMKTLFYVAAPCDGIVRMVCALGDIVKRGQVICRVLS